MCAYACASILWGTQSVTLYREMFILGPAEMVWMAQNSDIKARTLNKTRSRNYLAPFDLTLKQIARESVILKQNRESRHFLSSWGEMFKAVFIIEICSRLKWLSRYCHWVCFWKISCLEYLKYSVSCKQEGLITSQGHSLGWNIDILVNILVFQ